MDAIKTVGLSKLYGKKRAVDTLSFSVGCGEIYGFVGRNGAGKSTVMKMIAGLVLPTNGEIEILGEKMKPGCTSRRLGALIENPGIHPGLSGLDNVMTRALALGVPNAKSISLDALCVVGLSEVAKKRAKTYSLGMKQRLGLALALVGSPDLLLLDEPFNGLDPQGVRELRTTIVDLALTRNITVFISSHVLDQLERMVTRYGVIRDGALIREMTAEEVEQECADYLIIRAGEPYAALAKLQDSFPESSFVVLADDTIRAVGSLNPSQVGYVLNGAGIPVTELYVHERDIEELFVGLMGSEAGAGIGSKTGATQNLAGVSAAQSASSSKNGGGHHA